MGTFTIDDPYLYRVAQLESGLNPMAANPRSSAKGLFQFVDATAKQYGVNDPFNPQQSYEAAKRFTEDNRNALRNLLKREPTPQELYLAHQQGATGAAKLLQKPDAPVRQVIGEKQAVLNAGDPSMTAGDFASKWINKFGNIETQSQDIPQDNYGLPEGFTLDEGPQDLGAQDNYGLPEGFTLDEEVQAQPLPSDERGLLQKGLNLAQTYATGRTFGMGPKVAAGIGALVSKPILEAREAITGTQAPTLRALYEKGNEIYQAPTLQAREDTPILAGLSELSGGLKTGVGISKATSPIRSLFRGSSLPAKAAAGLAGGELASRTYQAGQSPIGEEKDILLSPSVGLGGYLGAAMPVGGSALSQLSKTVTPKISQGAQKTAELAKKYNIPLGLDDLTDSKFYKTLISEGESIPFSGAAKRVEKQLTAFTRAVAKTIGLDDADELTEENMRLAYEKIGKKFDALTKGKTFKVNDDVMSGFDDVRDVAVRGGYGDKGEDLLDKYLKEIYADINENGVVSGENIAKSRAMLNKVARKASDLNSKAIAKDLESVIADFITDGSPKALRDAKYQYKNFIAIEPLARKAVVDGQINPALLNNRVSKVFGRQATLGKAGELGDLARIGQLIKQQVPNSGTAQRSAIRNLLGGGGTDVLAGASALYNPLITAAYFGTKGAGMGVNRLLQNRNYNPSVVFKNAGQLKPNSALAQFANPASAGAGVGIIGSQ